MSEAEDRLEMEKRMQHEIPLSKHMGVKITSLSPHTAKLWAPLAPNINHKKTAFGGSVNAVAALAGWTLVTNLLKDHPGGMDYIVLQDSEIDYKLPIEDDFEAEASFATAAQEKSFFCSLERKGLARAKIQVSVYCRKAVCAEFKGRFVARRV